jgi:hypothetical protein
MGRSAITMGGIGSFATGGDDVACKVVGGDVGSDGGELGMTAGISAGAQFWGSNKHVDEVVSGSPGSTMDTWGASTSISSS